MALAAKDGLPTTAIRQAPSIEAPSIVFLAVVVENARVFPYTTISVSDPSSKILRITNFRNWSDDMSSDPRFSSLGFEFRNTPWSDLNDWSRLTDKTVLDYALKELRRFGFPIDGQVRHYKVIRIPPKESFDPGPLRKIKNIFLFDATNLGGTTAWGLEVPDQIANRLMRQVKP